MDNLVFATGFDAMTGPCPRSTVRRVGRTWPKSGGTVPTGHLGVAAGRLPNLFLITGPGSPSVLADMVVSMGAARRVGHPDYA